MLQHLQLLVGLVLGSLLLKLLLGVLILFPALQLGSLLL
jgi:hypothetical protein